MSDYFNMRKGKPVLPDLPIIREDEDLSKLELMVIGADNGVRRVKIPLIVPDPPVPDETALLSTFTINSYFGERLQPKLASQNGFVIKKNTNTVVGLAVINPNTTGNAAQSAVTVQGAGTDYQNYAGFSYYENNYFISWLRNSALLFSDRPLNFATWNSQPINFRTGITGLGDGILRFSISATGILKATNVPIYATDALAGTGGLTVGDIYKTSTGELRIKL